MSHKSVTVLVANSMPRFQLLQVLQVGFDSCGVGLTKLFPIQRTPDDWSIYKFFGFNGWKIECKLYEVRDLPVVREKTTV